MFHLISKDVNLPCLYEFLLVFSIKDMCFSGSVQSFPIFKTAINKVKGSVKLYHAFQCGIRLCGAEEGWYEVGGF